MPTHHLRRLAATVDESDPGDFYALVVESKDDASVWEDLWAAEAPVATWLEAWEAANTHLLTLVSDPARGPLAMGEDENASPVGGRLE